MQGSHRLTGLGNLLIDLDGALARKAGPLGLSAITGALCAFVGLAILWGFSHAGLYHREDLFFSLPVLMGACLGAISGWRAWCDRFDG